MPDASQPIANVAAKRSLEGRELRELQELREQVENLIVQPGWTAITGLLELCHDAVLEQHLGGPTRGGKQLNREVGYLAGLEELDAVVRLVRDVADKREKQAEAEAERRAPAERSTP